MRAQRKFPLRGWSGSQRAPAAPPAKAQATEITYVIISIDNQLSAGHHDTRHGKAERLGGAEI
jgi:hypothetical protein